MSIGSTLNSLTGASSAAATSQKYAIQSAILNNKFQKEFAQNAHQWEAKDLMLAGYNPALTTGLGGASASGGGVASATETSSGFNPLNAIAEIVNMKNSTSATKAQNNALEADADLKTAQAIQQLMETDLFKKLGEKEKMAMINKIIADTKYTNERARGFSETTTISEGKNKGWNLGGNAAGETPTFGKKKLKFSGGGNIGKNNGSYKSTTKSKTW